MVSSQDLSMNAENVLLAEDGADMQIEYSKKKTSTPIGSQMTLPSSPAMLNLEAMQFQVMPSSSELQNASRQDLRDLFLKHLNSFYHPNMQNEIDGERVKPDFPTFKTDREGRRMKCPQLLLVGDSNVKYIYANLLRKNISNYPTRSMTPVHLDLFQLDNSSEVMGIDVVNRQGDNWNDKELSQAVSYSIFLNKLNINKIN